MDWDKLLSFFGRVGGAIGGITAICAFIIFMLKNDVVQDYLKEAVDIPQLNIQMTVLASRVDETKEEIKQLSNNVTELTETISSMRTIGELSSEPILKFLEGSYITDGQIGQTVTFSIRFVKLRECGQAELSAWFMNGVKAIHAFEGISIIDESGRAIRARGAPGEVLERTWTARIPLKGGVTPGLGQGWIEVSYPDCPLVSVATSPLMAFQILDDDGRPVERKPNIEK